ncbi:MAG: serine hydrolase [Candidatus Margulisiibacteriota bacterium]
MKRRIFFLFFALVLFAQPSFSANRFYGLTRKFNSIVYDNYGRKVLPGYAIGVSFIDLKTNYRVSVRGSKVFPAASIIKIPVMAYLFYASDHKLLNLGSRIRFLEADKLPGAGVLQWLRPNKYTMWSLCRLMISVSDNTATRLLVRRAGKANINSYCKKIGLKNTRILDETALVEMPRPTYNRTTPNDIANLLLRIQRGPASFSKSARKDMIGFMRNQKYIFGIPRVLPNGFFCANKTGNLTNVLHDSAIVYSKRGTYVLVVFTKGFKRDRDARLVINRVSSAVAGYYR